MEGTQARKGSLVSGPCDEAGDAMRLRGTGPSVDSSSAKRSDQQARAESCSEELVITGLSLSSGRYSTSICRVDSRL